MHTTKLVGILLLCSGSVAVADTDGSSEPSRFDFYGDFRLRLEQDWDSLNGDGTLRDDRLRLRIRVRAGMEATLSDNWSAVVGARSGPHDSHQSPHITIADFDGGSTGPYEFNFDYWYLQYERNGFDVWIGRNEASFWYQDALFVFHNVTFPGMGASYKHDLGGGELTWNFDYVGLPVGMQKVSGTGLIGQAVFSQDFSDWGLTVSGSYFGTNADPGNPDGDALLTENNTRDYSVVNLMVQFRSRVFDMPYHLGVDLSHNLENYDDAPPGSFSEFHKSDRDGYVLQAILGESGDWQLGYYYSNLEALAVHSSYIADDWTRWGNANHVRATNLKGSEFRVHYWFSPNMNLFARLFLVDAIDLLQATDTTLETGNRFRIELNVSF